MRRALAIDERAYGPENPLVAIRLANLGQLLKSTHRLSEAEPLMRRALAIAERSYGPDHHDVALDLAHLAALLQSTHRLAEAESLMRRVLEIGERTSGPDDPAVAVDLNNLASVLRSTHRLAEAEPLLERAVRVFSEFQRTTGHEHPQFRVAMENYRELLPMLKLSESEIAARIKAAGEGTDKLSPIVPEVERLLGPAKSVADVLASLDLQYKEQGKPPIYFLKPSEPIAPYLDELLRPTVDERNAQGVLAFRSGAHANAVVLYEAELEMMADQPAQVPAKLLARMNRAAALRELGLLEAARDDLLKLLPELDQNLAADALTKGRAHYHLALCQWRLGDNSGARQSAEQSLAAFDGRRKSIPIDPGIRQQTEVLLADVKNGLPPPPLAAIDAPAALEAARTRYRAREALTRLPLDQKSAPLLDQLLGPAQSTEEVFAALDRQYREQGKPPVWFLPLNEPIAPHLEELLGKPAN